MDDFGYFEFEEIFPKIARKLVSRLALPQKTERAKGRVEQWLEEYWTFGKDDNTGAWVATFNDGVQGCSPMVYDFKTERWYIGEEEGIPEHLQSWEW